MLKDPHFMNIEIDKRYEKMKFFDAPNSYDIVDKNNYPIRLVDEFIYKT